MPVCLKAMVFITAWHKMGLRKDAGQTWWKIDIFQDFCALNKSGNGI